MHLALNHNEQELLDLLLTVPPRFDEAEQYIRNAGMTADSITKTAIRYAEACYEDIEHADFDDMPQEGLPGLHSSYIVPVIKLLLQYGLDANAVYPTEYGVDNIMQEILYIINGYLGVDALLLLLEHGGDPNLTVSGETLTEHRSFDIWFGSVEQETRWIYDIWVHQWMVLLAFGGRCGEDQEQPTAFSVYDEDGLCRKQFDLANLKNHRDFTFGLSVEDGERTIHIFDRKSFWKVAQWQ